MSELALLGGAKVLPEGIPSRWPIVDGDDEAAVLRALRGGTWWRELAASVGVTNTGSRADKEVVQVYVAECAPRLPRPPKELRAFRTIELDAGQSQVVRLCLPRRAFALFDPEREEWTVEPGRFRILVGGRPDALVEDAVACE